MIEKNNGFALMFELYVREHFKISIKDYQMTTYFVEKKEKKKLVPYIGERTFGAVKRRSSTY